jgi:hypothetical protein
MSKNDPPLLPAAAAASHACASVARSCNPPCGPGMALHWALLGAPRWPASPADGMHPAGPPWRGLCAGRQVLARNLLLVPAPAAAHDKHGIDKRSSTLHHGTWHQAPPGRTLHPTCYTIQLRNPTLPPLHFCHQCNLTMNEAALVAPEGPQAQASAAKLSLLAHMHTGV